MLITEPKLLFFCCCLLFLFFFNCIIWLVLLLEIFCEWPLVKMDSDGTMNSTTGRHALQSGSFDARLLINLPNQYVSSKSTHKRLHSIKSMLMAHY